LGVETEPLSDGSVRVSAVVPDGPSAKAGVKEGEFIVGVGEDDLQVDDDLDKILSVRDGKLPETIELLVKDAEGNTRTISTGLLTRVQFRQLRYDNWIKARKARVEELSGGRLAYHHVRFMAGKEVTRLRDAIQKEFPDAEGLVLDGRDGQGGMAHRPLLHVLDSTAPKRLDGSPACYIRSRNGKSEADRYGRGSRVKGPHWDRPVTLLVNEVARSDKEILAYTFSHLKLGYVVDGVGSYL
jgi:tricorn protease